MNSDTPGDEGSDRVRPPADGAAAEPSDVDPPQLDTVFDVLSDERRRIILSTLIERDGPVALSDLVAQVRRRETEFDPGRGTTDERRRIAIDLHHVQLPALLGARLVDYDSDAETVSVTSTARSVQPFLELAAEYPDA